MRNGRHALAVNASVTVFLAVAALTGHAQRGRSAALGEGPWSYRTPDAQFQVTVVTKGLVKPWSMAFLPDGTVLVRWSGESDPDAFIAKLDAALAV